MKKLLLAFLCIPLVYSLNAQTMKTVDGDKGAIMEPAELQKIHLNSPVYNKKTDVEGWYSWVDAAGDFGYTFTRITNSTLFPDSTVKQVYGAAGGGTELGYTGLHSIGQVFDPTSFLFGADALSEYNPYTIDSISFAGYYSHNIPGTVDTLLVQILDNTDIESGTLQGGGIWASTSFSKSINRHSGPAEELRILLDEDDTSYTTGRFFTVAIPNGGLSIPGDGLSGITVTFLPGYSYNTGDTIQQDWSPEPVNKLNHFKAYVLQDASKTADESYNMGMRASKASKYRSDTWENRYIPGSAWNNYNEHLYAQFYIRAQGVGIKERTSAATLGKAYPNPVLLGEDISIDFSLTASADVTVEIYNMIGQKMGTVAKDKFATGEHTVNFNTSSLKPGMYFYTMKAGNYTKTYRFSVTD